MSSVGSITGKSISYKGQSCEVVSTYKEYVTIQLPDGKQISVNYSELKNTPLLEYRKSQQEKRGELIEYYRNKAESAGKEKQSWIEKVHEIWSQMLGLDKTDEQYALLKDEYWQDRFKKTAASNSEYGYYMSAYRVASGPIA